ncbi:MAG: hypothetical protein AABW84_02030 [Nanoarchaeota archaeon]
MAIQHRTLDDKLQRGAISVPPIQPSKWVELSTHAYERARERLGLTTVREITNTLITHFRNGVVVASEDGSKCVNFKHKGNKLYIPFVEESDHYYLLTVCPGFANPTSYSRLMLKK